MAALLSNKGRALVSDFLAPFPANSPPPLSTWLHWKGATATVLATSRHTATGEFLVTYLKEGQYWTRPLAEWDDEARPGIIRFTRVG